MTTYYNINPKFYVSVDCIIFGFDEGELKLLLLKRNFEPAMGKWSLMGGFVQEDESVDAAAKRVLAELTGLENVYMEQVGTFGDLERDPGERVISVAYYALVNVNEYDRELVQQHNAHWTKIDELPQLIFDHPIMISKARELMKHKASYNPIGFNLLPELFTLTQLQNLYEAIYGVSYDDMKAEDMVVVDLDGNVVEGSLRPSSDTPTHVVLYKAFPEIGGVVHTHSTYATAWAQAGMDIPNIGTTHADYFHDAIPCTADMTEEEVKGAYEQETGNVIVKRFKNLNPVHTPGVLVKNHGPFAWGKDANDAVHNAVVMEQVAKMASIAFAANPHLTMNSLLIEKHFSRKHGPNAYYGQK